MNNKYNNFSEIRRTTTVFVYYIATEKFRFKNIEIEKKCLLLR